MSFPRYPWHSSVLILFALAFLAGFAGISEAATIRQVGTNELLGASKLIFHGRVLERWSEPGAVGDSILTQVVFEVADVIKGDYADETIVLTFLGGTLNGLVMHIEGSSVPDVGEEGIYFIEDPTRFQINPLYGWMQGHFTIQRRDSGRSSSVHTFAGEPVYGLRADAGPPRLEFAHAHARGVDTEARAAAAVPLSVEEFKQRLRALLEAVR